MYYNSIVKILLCSLEQICIKKSFNTNKGGTYVENMVSTIWNIFSHRNY